MADVLNAWRITLVCLNAGKQFGRRFVLEGPRCARIGLGTEGRDGDGNLAGVSIRQLDGRFALGAPQQGDVLVNDAPVEGLHHLLPGDCIRVGSACYRFQLDEWPDQWGKARWLGDERGMARIYEACKAALKRLRIVEG